MKQTLQFLRSAVPSKKPTVSQLELGELSMNTYDGKLFMKKSGSSGESIVSFVSFEELTGSLFSNSISITGSLNVSGGITGSLQGTATTASYYNTSIRNIINVGLTGSNVAFNSIKAAVDSITDASVNNTYTVRVYPGVYIENTITMKSWITVKGDSSTTTIVSGSNPSASVFIGAD